MKKFFTKLCLLMALCLIGGNAWAEVGDVTTNVNIDFSNSIVDGVVAGTKGSMTIGTGSGAAARVEGGWLRQGDVTNVVTIPEAERAGTRDQVKVSLKMAWGNKNGMGSKFVLKDADGEVICQLSHCRWGSSSNDMNINLSGLVGSAWQNAPILDRYTKFDITIDYAAKTITSIVSCTNPNASQTFVTTLNNTKPVASFETAGFNVGGNTDRADGFDDLLIETVEGNYAATTANYTVKYVDESDNEIKTAETRVGDVGTEPGLISSDKEPIYVGEKKYAYKSDNASELKIAEDGSTIVIVMFTEVAKYSYSIKAEDSEHNILKTIASGATFTDEAVNLYIPLQLYSEGKLYGISGEDSWRSYTITSENQSEVVTYPNVVNNVVAFTEGESAEGAAESTPTGNLKLASCGHMGRGTNLPVGSVAAGKYKVTFHYVNTNGSDHPVTIKAGATDIATINAAKSSRNDYTTDEFTVAEDNTDITFSVGGSSTSGVDYIYIVQTEATVSISAAAGYATFVTQCAVDFEGTGITAYSVKVDAENSKVVLTEKAQVPAGKAVVVKGATANVPVIAEAGDFDTDLLYSNSAIAFDADPSVTYYALASKNDKVVFAPVISGSIAAGKGYFTIEKSKEAPAFFIDLGEETAIEGIQAAKAVESTEAFNISGQRVSNNFKGIVIKNGAKYLVK